MQMLTWLQLVGTVGLSLTIPGAMLADFLFWQDTFGLLYVVGCVLVVAGFLTVNGHEIAKALRETLEKFRRRE